MEVVNEYGADALRMYLINSPVVRAEPLRFRKEGVFAVVKDLFLPWYNAYRFLVQNVLRMEAETGASFEPSKVHACQCRMPVQLCARQIEADRSQPTSLGLLHIVHSRPGISRPDTPYSALMAVQSEFNDLDYLSTKPLHYLCQILHPWS